VQVGALSLRAKARLALVAYVVGAAAVGAAMGHTAITTPPCVFH
jgi:hypothetical protein